MTASDWRLFLSPAVWSRITTGERAVFEGALGMGSKHVFELAEKIRLLRAKRVAWVAEYFEDNLIEIREFGLGYKTNLCRH